MWGLLFLVVVLVLLGYGIGYPDGNDAGYEAGWKDGRAAERKSVRFTPVDKFEPCKGYHPPLRDPAWEALQKRVGEAEKNSRPKGYTPGGDPYRSYDCELKDL